MDQSHALFLGYDKEEATLLEDLPSGIVSRSRIAGEGSDSTLLGPSPGPSSNNEKKRITSTATNPMPTSTNWRTN